MEQKPTMPARERIWSTIQELASVGKSFTRQRLAAITGLKFHVVDDHMDRFIEEDLVHRIGAGVFELVQHYPPDEPISITALDDGRVKLERGDGLWTLNPAEVRRLAKMLQGWSTELAYLDTQADLIAIVNRIDTNSRRDSARIAEMDRAIRAAEQKIDQQLSLL